jgi:DNA-binding response OmpR family regulator
MSDLDSVILAEPRRDISGSLRNYLEERGIVVFPAHNAQEVKQVAAHLQPLLVVLGIDLPAGSAAGPAPHTQPIDSRLSSYDTCLNLRQLPGYARVPIVMTSPLDRKKFHHAAARAGADLLLPRPYSILGFVAAIEPLLRDPGNRLRAKLLPREAASSELAETQAHFWRPGGRPAGPAATDPTRRAIDLLLSHHALRRPL